MLDPTPIYTQTVASTGMDPMAHVITVVPAQKMDAPRGFVRAVCSCGYVSAIGSPKRARQAGEGHRASQEWAKK